MCLGAARLPAPLRCAAKRHAQPLHVGVGEQLLHAQSPRTHSPGDTANHALRRHRGCLGTASGNWETGKERLKAARLPSPQRAVQRLYGQTHLVLFSENKCISAGRTSCTGFTLLWREILCGYSEDSLIPATTSCAHPNRSRSQLLPFSSPAFPAGSTEQFFTLGTEQEKEPGNATGFLPQTQISTSLLLSPSSTSRSQKPRRKPAATPWLANCRPYHPKTVAKTR